MGVANARKLPDQESFIVLGSVGREASFEPGCRTEKVAHPYNHLSTSRTIRNLQLLASLFIFYKLG